ncbi:DNA cytosine methyltransferase, partial [Acinetobacter baumannii]
VKGGHHGLVTAKLSKNNYEGAMRVAAFIINYYGNGDARDIRAPMDTITTKDRLALVTVWIRNEPFMIVDICLRMF